MWFAPALCTVGGVVSDATNTDHGNSHYLAATALLHSSVALNLTQTEQTNTGG